MNNTEPIYLTPEGIDDLRSELDHLVNVKRSALADRLHKAIQQGDLSENADYITAKEEQGFLEGRIQQIEVMLRRAVAIGEANSSDQVALGSTVVVVENGGKAVEQYHIVGSAEANPTNGKVSYESPVGKALLGHRVGDTVAVRVPAGEIAFTVVAIQ
jgi:transcription elongation factor GreA